MSGLITNQNLYDLNAEASVLSAMMMGNEPTGSATEHLRLDHFFDHKHKMIFKALLHMFEDDLNIDAITLIDYIRRNGLLKTDLEINYLRDICDCVVSDANLQYHIDIVKEKYRLREIAKTNAEVDKYCQMGDKSSRDIIDIIEQRLSNIDYHREREGLKRASSFTLNVLEELSAQMLNGTPIGIQTGFDQLDRIICGMRAGHLVVMAGRPAMGKTTMAVHMIYNIASNGKKVAFFSMEMSSEEIMHKLLSLISGVDGEKILSGRSITPEDSHALAEAGDVIEELDITIDDSPDNTPVQIKSKVRREGFNGKKPDIIFVDHIGLMHFSGSKRNDNENTEMTNISRALKKLAKELQIPIVELCQLNRKLEDREDKRPRLADLRSSGAIEQDADKVFFLYRDDYYKKENSFKPNITEVIVAKNRNGRIGTMELYFDKEHSRFLPRVIM